jgi:hypothetical protein
MGRHVSGRLLGDLRQGFYRLRHEVRLLRFGLTRILSEGRHDLIRCQGTEHLPELIAQLLRQDCALD